MSYASILAAQRQNYMNISLIGWSHLRSLRIFGNLDICRDKHLRNLKRAYSRMKKLSKLNDVGNYPKIPSPLVLFTHQKQYSAQQLSTAAWISNKQTSLNLSRKPALEYFLMLTTFLMDQPWFNRAVLSLKQRRKTPQEFRMLSRSLSDCKSLLLNVMIQVSSFIRNGQLCH